MALTVVGGGVDTLALVYRPLDWSSPGLGDRVVRGFDSLPSVGGSETARLVRVGAGGERVFWFPSHRLVRVEGRASAMVSRDEGNHGLGSALDVARVSEHVGLAHLSELSGAQVVGERCEVARVDIAADVRCSRSEGLALLRAIGHSEPPRAKWATWTNKRDRLPETVSLVTEGRGRPQFRAYDKGLESGAWGRGERIRLERQSKVGDRKRRPDAAGVTPAYLAERWGSHVRPVLEHARVVTVGGAAALDTELAERVRFGELSFARGASLRGALGICDQLAGTEWADDPKHRRTLQRWRSELARQGLAVVRDGGADLVRVDVPGVLRECAALLGSA